MDVAAEADRDGGEGIVDKHVGPIPRGLPVCLLIMIFWLFFINWMNSIFPFCLGGKVAVVHDVLSRTSPLFSSPSNVCSLRANYSSAHTDVQVELVDDLLTYSLWSLSIFRCSKCTRSFHLTTSTEASGNKDGRFVFSYCQSY